MAYREMEGKMETITTLVQVETGDSTQKLLCFDLEVSPACEPNG